MFFGICLLENLSPNTVFHVVYSGSESFEKHDDQGAKDMGLRCLRFVTGFCLGIGMTFAYFQVEGIGMERDSHWVSHIRIYIPK